MIKLALIILGIVFVAVLIADPSVRVGTQATVDKMRRRMDFDFGPGDLQ